MKNAGAERRALWALISTLVVVIMLFWTVIRFLDRVGVLVSQADTLEYCFDLGSYDNVHCLRLGTCYCTGVQEGQSVSTLITISEVRGWKRGRQ